MLLDVRKAIEERIISECSERQRVLQKEKEALEGLRQQNSELIQALRSITDRTVPAADISMQAAHIKRRRLEEALQERSVRNAEQKLNEKREELIEAAKKKKTMEIYRSRHLERHQAQERSLERNVVDELAITRHGGRKAK